MLENIIRWSLRNRFIVLALAAFILLAGLYTLWKTPVDAIPDLSDVQVIVKTSYPGQAPQVVEDQITYPIETAMLAVPGAVTVRGYSFFGDSYVYIIFDENTDLYWARSRVLEYLNQISGKLPPTAKPEMGPDATGVGWVYEYALKDPSGELDISQLTTIQNWILKYELQTVPGVAEVATIGGMVKQYQITVNPNKLKAYGFTLKQVKLAVQQANQEVGGSVAEMAEAEYMIRATGYIQNLKDIEDIPLGVGKNGTPIYVANVATVKFGPEARRGVAELNGEGETVGGVIIMRQGENALSTINGVKQKLAQIQTSLPKGVEIVPVYDRSSLIERSIQTLSWTLILQFIIVCGICLLFLFHFRSSLVVVFSLPIGVMIAFIIMRFQGINANIMSLGGIAIGVGVMVDAAIILIENMHSKKVYAQENNLDLTHWQIVEEASVDVGPTIFFSLLITMVSFMPIFALEAQEGRLFSPLAFTKTYAMAGAAALAITLIPVLIGYFVKGKIRPKHKHPINKLLIKTYYPILNIALRYPKSLIVLTLIMAGLTYWPYSKIGSEFMPDLNEGDLMYMPTMLPGVSIGKAREVLQQTDKLIKSIPEVKSVFGKVGRAQTATDPAPMTMIETVVQLKPKDQWREGMTIIKLKQELNQAVKLPGITNAWVMPIRTRIDMLTTGIKTPVGIKIIGPSLAKIQEIGQELEQILPQVKGTASVYADRAVGGRYIDVDINRKASARYGLNIADIQEMIRAAIGGMNITETIEGRERFPVNLRFPQSERNDIQSIKQLPLTTPTGNHILLQDVAEIKVTEGPPAIKSENAQLTGWVLVDISNRDLGSYVESAQKLVQEKLSLPSGYRLLWTGQYESMERANARLMILIPLTILLIFFLLYLHSRNFMEVSIVMVTIPLSFIGSFWFMYILGYNMSVAVAVGFIALAGIAGDESMVLLHFLKTTLKEKLQEKQNTNQTLTKAELVEAIKAGSLMRIRPLTMAISSTLVGLVPIMISTGTGSEVMRRIAAPMFGGMVSATFLTLVIIPCVFYLWKCKSLQLNLKK